MTDNGAAGLSFGSADPNTTNNPEAEAPTAAINLAVAVETNVNTSIEVKGIDFDDGAGHTLASPMPSGMSIPTL